MAPHLGSTVTQGRVTAAHTTFLAGCFSATAGESRWLTVQTASSRGKPVSDAIRCFYQRTPSIPLSSVCVQHFNHCQVNAFVPLNKVNWFVVCLVYDKPSNYNLH